MSEKKYATFRDLRTVSPAPAPASPTVPTSSPSISSISSTPSISKTPKSGAASGTSIAPERDFQRVPNSVTKQAMAGGSFRGKSKQVWDYLWSVSRGAVVPTRTVRKSRKEIKVGSGLGSMVTVDAAIEHLENVGLISIKPSIGSLLGNNYEVFTPEEASTSTSSISSTSRYTSLTQKLDDLDILDSSISSTTQTVDFEGTYPLPNTSFKTKEQSDDDEAFAKMLRGLKEATKSITGKEPSASEAERWNELGELLITELKIAAARTSVSSVPAFLTEHLRRRLWKREKEKAGAENSYLHDEEVQHRSFTPEQVKSCLDCGGSGFWYPQGYEKGVAKCGHEKLKG